MRKHKIIDTFFFYDEIEMLYFRLTEMDEYVDEFIIMECEMDFKGNSKPLNYLENKSMFKKWESKITYLPSPKITIEDLSSIYESIDYTKFFSKKNNNLLTKNDIRFFQITTLIGVLLEKPLSFEDLILISDVDEIPNLSESKTFKQHLKFGPIVLKQKNFIWSTKYIDIISNLGTLGFQYTNIITRPNLIYMSYFHRKNKTYPEFEVIDNGYHLSHFYDLKTTLSKLELLHDENSDYDLSELNNRLQYSYENLTSIKPNRNERDYNLIEYDGELPKNIHLLKNQLIGRSWDKKNLIIFNFDTINNVSDIEEVNDSVCIINFTNDASLPYETQVSEKTIYYNILKPMEIYYKVDESSNLEEFQKIFSINDTKKIIYDLLPIKQDLIIFLNSENPSNTIKYSWGEVKDNLIYDLVKDIL
jgi:hypothetical protein